MLYDEQLMVLDAPVLCLQVLTRRKRSQHGGLFGTLSTERHRQRRRLIQRKHPRVHLHRARILVTSQRLNDFRRLTVLEHVHDIGVAEGVRRHRDGEMHPVIIRPLRQPSASCASSHRSRPTPIRGAGGVR